MTEYYTVKRIDNSRLARPSAPNRFRELCRRMAWGTALASCLLFYAWQHFECIQLRYTLEQLQSEKSQAAQLNQQLHLEDDSLRSPMRIDAIARQQLGLTVPVPGQVAPAQGSSADVLAQVRSQSQVPRP
ncbi:MAG: cell division protein FtsL [Candidatus Acidiferrales bacterium]